MPSGVKMTHNDYVERLKEVNNNIEVVGIFTTQKNKLKFRCLVDDCNNEWEAKAGNVLNGCGCPKCGKKSQALKRRKPNAQFEEELKNHCHIVLF